MCLAYIPAQTITIYVLYIYIKPVNALQKLTRASILPSGFLFSFPCHGIDRPSANRAHLLRTCEKEKRKRGGNDTFSRKENGRKEGRKEALSSGDKSFSFESVVVAGLRRVTTIKRIVRAREGKREPVRFLPLGLDPPTRVPSNPHSREVRAARTRHHPVPVQRRVIRFIIER